MVEVDGEKLIKQAFSEITSSTTDNQLTGAVDIDTLQGQLEVKDRQIEQQVQTITRLTDALAAAQQTAAAAQALHAGTIKQQLSDGSGTEQEERKESWISRLFRKNE